MKIMITFIGVMITLAGVLPFLANIGIVPSKVPTSGMYYSLLIVVIGAVALVYGFVNKMIMGAERVVTVIIAVLTILGGVLPFIASMIPGSIPTSGPFYSLIIVVIGVIGIVYGVIALG